MLPAASAACRRSSGGGWKFDASFQLPRGGWENPVGGVLTTPLYNYPVQSRQNKGSPGRADGSEEYIADRSEGYRLIGVRGIGR